MHLVQFNCDSAPRLTKNEDLFLCDSLPLAAAPMLLNSSKSYYFNKQQLYKLSFFASANCL